MNFFCSSKYPWKFLHKTNSQTILIILIFILYLPGVWALSIEEVGAVGVGRALGRAHVVPHVPVRHALVVQPKTRVLRVAVVLFQGEGPEQKYC